MDSIDREPPSVEIPVLACGGAVIMAMLIKCSVQAVGPDPPKLWVILSYIRVRHARHRGVMMWRPYTLGITLPVLRCRSDALTPYLEALDPASACRKGVQPTP